jgi:hypothetical protein
MVVERDSFFTRLRDERYPYLNLKFSPSAVKVYSACPQCRQLAHTLFQRLQMEAYRCLLDLWVNKASSTLQGDNSLRVGFGYVSCNLNATRFMKYPRSSAPPTISESAAEVALRTATVQRWVWSGKVNDAFSSGVRTVAVFPYIIGRCTVTPWMTFMSKNALFWLKRTGEFTLTLTRSLLDMAGGFGRSFNFYKFTSNHHFNQIAQDVELAG